ncbi:MAG: DMT family transporter [Microbacteriaceae bacterium]
MSDAKRTIPAIVAMAMWATNFVFSPAVLGVVGPIQLTGVRWILSLVALVPLAFWLESPNFAVIRGEWKTHVIQSILGYVGYTLLLYNALGMTSPVTAAVLVALNPATIAIAAQYVLHDKLSVAAVLGITVSFIGAVIVVLGGQNLNELSLGLGDAWLLVATVLWTAYSMIAPRVKTPPITATAVQAAMSGLMMIPLMAFDLISGNAGWLHLDGTGWLGVIWIGLIPSAGAYFLWNISSEWIGPTRTGTFLNLIPVFTAVFVLLLGGSVTVWHILGGALVLVGVTFAGRRSAKQ